MKPTWMQRAAVLGWALMCGTLSVSCAEGSPSKPPIELKEQPLPMAPTCGNGKLDANIGEMCDCPMSGISSCPIDNMTCGMMGYSGGFLLCTTCMVDIRNCTGGRPTAGSGTGGTGR